MYLRLSFLAGVFAAIVYIISPVNSPAESPREFRGVWITNVDSDVLTSKEKIAEAMDFLAATGFNVVFPVVWNKAYTLYPSDVMESAFGRRIDPLYGDRDPLAELIVEAHRNGLEVIPWFEYGFASAYNTGAPDRPEGGFILDRKPEWRALNFAGELVEKNKFEWMNAFDPEVQDFLLDLVVEVAENYDIDGIQGDDRLPALPSTGGYDEATRARYHAETGLYAPKLQTEPPWVQWRADILTEFLAELRRRVKSVDNNLLVSMSPSPFDWSLREYLQDSKSWVARGLVDALHPQVYRYDFEKYRSTLDETIEKTLAPETLPLLAPGILAKVGSYRIEPDFLLECIALNRERGVMGESLFFYEGLREEDGILATALREGPYARRAAVPQRGDLAWRPAGVLAYPAPLKGSASAWKVSKSDPRLLEFKLRPTGSPPAADEVVYTAHIEHSGIYDLYTKVPVAPDNTEHAAYVLQGSNGRQPALLDQSDPAKAGWVYLGDRRLERGPHAVAFLHPTPGAADRTTHAIAGPMLLLLNRKKMREQ